MDKDCTEETDGEVKGPTSEDIQESFDAFDLDAHLNELMNFFESIEWSYNCGISFGISQQCISLTNFPQWTKKNLKIKKWFLLFVLNAPYAHR